MGLTDFFRHDFVGADWRIEGVDCAWPVDELIGNRFELRLVLNQQIVALGQVLPDQSIEVLATAPLSRAVRVIEGYLDAPVGAQLCMPSHLLALVVRQRLAHRFGNAAQLGGEALQGRCGRGDGQLLASITWRQLRFISTPTAERLPAPLKRSPSQCQGNVRSFASGGRTRMLSTSGSWPLLSLPSERGMRLLWARRRQAISSTVQLPAGHGLYAVVDVPVRDGASRALGPHAPECARDLRVRGRPAFGQIVACHTKEHGVHRQLGATPGFEVLVASP
jgi:hypothetical protein